MRNPNLIVAFHCQELAALGKLPSRRCINIYLPNNFEANHKLPSNTAIGFGIFTLRSMFSGFMAVQDNGLSKHTGV